MGDKMDGSSITKKRHPRYEAMKAIKDKWKQQGICMGCGTNKTQENKVLCLPCATRNRKNQIDRRKRERELIFGHYGKVCVCCFESTIELLTIDHIYNNGNAHRKELKNRGGEHFYRWLIKNKYPRGFQTLCWNCNVGKNMGRGVCPHLKNVLENIDFLRLNKLGLKPPAKLLFPSFAQPVGN